MFLKMTYKWHNPLVPSGDVANISSDLANCMPCAPCILGMFVLVVFTKMFLFLYAIRVNFLHQRVLHLFSMIIISKKIAKTAP